jgi:DNA-binding transcriptional regulator LsrR (DeoR family)
LDLPEYYRKDHRSARSGNRKLSNQAARQAYESPLSDTEVAGQLGVCARTINRLRRKQTYRNVTMGL